MSIKGILIGLAMLVFFFMSIIVVSCVLINDMWDGENCDETQCDACPFPCEKHEERR